MAGRETKYFYKGIPAAHAARKKGMSYATFYARLKQGWTIKHAIETPLNPIKRVQKRQWIIKNDKNKAFKSAAALAEYLGVTKNVVIGREHRHGSPFKIGKYKIEKQ